MLFRSILREEDELKADIGRLRARLRGAEAVHADLSAVERLLAELNERADQPWSFDQKRRVVTTLVKAITIRRGDGGEPVAHVKYQFDHPVREVRNTSGGTPRERRSAGRSPRSGSDGR